MTASHANLRDDYEVSVLALDILVGMLQETKAVFGDRLTGAGFGGACVALVAAGKTEGIAQNLLERYKRSRYVGSAVLDRLPIATILQVTA